MTNYNDKSNQMRVLIELEKLQNIRFDILWDYLNFGLLQVDGIDDENFVRADDFHKNIDILLKARTELKREITGNPYEI